MDAKFRAYQKNDYTVCEKLVDEAWQLSTLFSTPSMGSLALYFYTKGPEVESNFQQVVEINGEVVGFLFGLNKHAPKPRLQLLSRLNMAWKFISEKSKEKKSLITALKQHEDNRTAIVSRDKSEIQLFVISKKYQGKGYGAALWQLFCEYCQQHGAYSVIVETNRLGASTYYEKLGFEILSDFESPLHEIATKGGTACMLEYPL